MHHHWSKEPGLFDLLCAIAPVRVVTKCVEPLHPLDYSEKRDQRTHFIQPLKIWQRTRWQIQQWEYIIWATLQAAKVSWNQSSLQVSEAVKPEHTTKPLLISKSWWYCKGRALQKGCGKHVDLTPNNYQLSTWFGHLNYKSYSISQYA